MLINDKRALAYSAKISDIKEIENADNIELVFVNGWPVISKKGEFSIGDLCIFFEIDSKLPEKDWSSFLSSKGYKVKIYKLSKFNVISEGLALPYSIFPRDIQDQLPLCEGVDVTELLGVKYSVKEDNYRKSNSSNKEDRFNQFKSKHRKFFSNTFIKYLLRYKWFRKVIYIFIPKKKSRGFPSKFEYIHKTDEERVENIPWVLNNKDPFIVTEKVDGTSCTYILERKPFGKFEFYVTSRNVRMINENQECYHSTNIYWDLAKRYNIEGNLKEYLYKNKKLKYVCIQGEGVGPSIQGNPLKLEETDLYVFNFITSDIGRWNSLIGREFIESIGMKWVPIVETKYILPDDIEELKIYTDGKSMINKKVNREGIVLRNSDKEISFKSVSREYLLKKKD